MNPVAYGCAKVLVFTGIFMMQYSCEKTVDEEFVHALKSITDFDGNTYYIKEFGNQWWMVNNLKVTHYADGTEIPAIEDPSEWEFLDLDERAYCYYNNNKSGEALTYGALYTWAAATNGGAGSDPGMVQGVCPDGWHLPSDNEWKELEMYLGMSQADANDEGYRGFNEGSQLAHSADLWANGYLKENPVFGTSGFLAIPGGGRRYNGTFGHLGDNSNFWTATEKDQSVAWGRHIYAGYSTVHRYSDIKSDGFSVRCVRDH